MALCLFSIALFLLIPGSIEGKALAVLHGLCAQQPTHSLYFGDQRLPFDARMTGIYGGFALTVAYLLAHRRWRFGDVPSTPVVTVLALVVGLLAVDGVNSTLRDMGYWHAYTPLNAARLITGMLTGTALAVFIWMLVAQVGFAAPARVRRPALSGISDLGRLLLIEGVAAAVILTGWSPLRLPLTFLQLTAAIAVVTGLALAFVLLLGRREARALTTGDLAGPATIALTVALLTIGALAGGRFLLEWWLGIEPVVRGGL